MGAGCFIIETRRGSRYQPGHPPVQHFNFAAITHQPSMNPLRPLLIFSCALTAITCPAKDPAPTMPKETPLFVTGEADDRMDDRIFPLGWSADGKFAWITRKVEEASDEGMWSLTILDAAANKTLETIEFTLPDQGFKGIAKFWAKNQKAILATLKKHGVKMTPTPMDHLPVILGHRRGRIVAAELTPVEAKTTYDELGVKSFKLTLRLGQAKNPLAEKTYTDPSMPYAVAIAGCYHSPDEAFGVIVVTALERGWEGSPHPRTVDAMAGFRLETP